MDRSSPSRTAGVVVRKVWLGGDEFTLSQPDKVRKAADEEAVVISRRQLPKSLTGDDRKEAINAMMCGIATPEEFEAYRRSAWRLAFRFWNALDPTDRMKYAGVSGKTPAELIAGVEWAYEVLSSDERTVEEFDNLWRAILMTSQEELVGNSSGPHSEAGTQQMDRPTTEAGLPSTTSSSEKV